MEIQDKSEKWLLINVESVYDSMLEEVYMELYCNIKTYRGVEEWPSSPVS